MRIKVDGARCCDLNKGLAGEEGYVRETHLEIGRATGTNVIVEQLCWKCFTHLISLHIKTVVVLSSNFIVLLSCHFPFVLCYHCQSVISNQLQANWKIVAYKNPETELVSVLALSLQSC